jgi:hypothetical protein
MPITALLKTRANIISSPFVKEWFQNLVKRAKDPPPVGSAGFFTMLPHDRSGIFFFS